MPGRTKPPPNTDEDRALRLILEGTAHETGEAFFRALVRNLAEALDAPIAWVTEWVPEGRTLRSLAWWMDGRYLEEYEYPVDGTPCQPVVEKVSLAHFPDRVFEFFPIDPDLRPFGAVSYLGAPLVDADGSLLGHMSVMDRKPMPARPRMLAVFELFAARASAEYRRLRLERELRSQQERLELLFDSAMDAIVVMDGALRILRVNPGALRVFGCGGEDLVGENFRDFLSPESAAALEGLARDVAERSELGHRAWIPSGLAAVRWDRRPFAAEGTLATYEYGGARHFAVVLRDAGERREWEQRLRALSADAEYLREVVGGPEMGIVGRSAAVRGVREAVRQVAPTNATVLVLGETGTGKELVARAIHEAGARSGGPLVRVNCAAIPESLVESEFFGHEKGAFTGATSRREGRFAQADGGTLFLDEAGELPLDLQAKLLRVLQEGEFEPLGASRTRRVDVRVVAATNRNLEDEIAAGRFREDLFYRLNVFPIRIPPLRERGADVLEIAKALASRLARQMGRRIEPLDGTHAELLGGYAWPGNVRELQNVIERALILSTGPRLDLARAMPAGAGSAISAPAPSEDDARILTCAELETIERTNMRCALEAAGWKVSGAEGAAARLGLAPSTLTSRMKALGIRKEE